MQVLRNDSLSRALHNALYERMVSFSELYTPEFPAVPVVRDWLNRFYSGDTNIAFVVDLDDDFKLIAHAVILINEAYGYKVIMVPQLQDDTKQGKFIAETVEYVDKLLEETNSFCSEILVTKNVKVYEKKFGYKAVRTVMLKYNSEVKS